ncbi:FCD domain-containing protein [Quisquiliibacterium transsilvanicum]|uniref:DNA-binding GntR family transcriptional regulator n=1 Tax=Quisquiliibacterium transsilvanicum TaxID=1549638 RepID=A0A7W8HEJ2_9BURK|nr:DNA-binding GntR family transcriptional regulator [Quisquiliibacterium transsilvanicum]
MTIEALSLRPQSAPAQPGDARTCASAQLARAIVDGLEAGGFAPGQRLVEADLCERFGVGRSAVRDALQRLAARGVVTLSPNKGARISEVTLADALDTLELTELLLGLAARTAARSVSGQGVAEAVGNALRQLEQARELDDPRRFAAARKAFYATLIRAGGNQALRRVLPSVQVHVLRARFGFSTMQAEVFDEFRAIGAAVLAGDPERAERLGREHVRRIRERMEQNTTTIRTRE